MNSTIVEGAHPDVVNLKMGRGRTKSDPRTVQFGALLAQTKIIIPESKKRSSLVKAPWGMLGNDEYGDCAWADTAHQMMVWGAVEKNTSIQNFTADQVVASYMKYTGGQDQGTNMLDQMNLMLTEIWANFGGKCIDAFAGIGLGSALRADVKGSIYVTGGCSLGVALPLALQRTPYDWYNVTINKNDPNWQPGSWGGHAVVAVDYDSSGVWIITWGKLVHVSWTMLEYILEEAYAIMSPYWRNRKGNTPQGITAAQVKAWLAQHRAA